jgi:hypothetical protein
MIQRKQFLRMGVLVTLITFVLLAFAVRFILRAPLEMQNYLAFLIFSLIVGTIISVLIYTEARIAAGFFLFGVGLGFFEMYRVFSRDMAGWGDLIGLMSLFFWTAIGLGVGLLGQAGAKLLQKKKAKP